MSNRLTTKNSIKQIKLIYYLVIAILVIYSCYKNGYLLYAKGLTNIGGIFKPLWFVLGAILTSYIVLFIKYFLVKKKQHFLKLVTTDWLDIAACLITLMMPVNMNALIYFSVLFIILLGMNFFRVKEINVLAIARFILLYLATKYIFLNDYEATIATSYKTLDLFLGRAIGGMGTISTFFLIICFFILLFIPAYKKEIPIYANFSYALMLFFYCIMGHSYISLIKDFLNSDFVFMSILIATIPQYSPVKEEDKIVMGVCLGIVGFISNLFILREGSYIALLISNMILYFFQWMRKKWTRRENMAIMRQEEN